MMPSADVNSVIIRPQPPRLRIKRRNTVSVTPAMGASTVAGRISTPPSDTDAGTRASAGALRSAGLSKYLCITDSLDSNPHFYIRMHSFVVDQVLLNLGELSSIDTKTLGSNHDLRARKSLSLIEMIPILPIPSGEYKRGSISLSTKSQLLCGTAKYL